MSVNVSRVLGFCFLIAQLKEVREGNEDSTFRKQLVMGEWG